MKPISYNISEYRGEAYNQQVDLILDPRGDEIEITNFCSVGSGTTMDVYHNRQRCLGTYDKNVVAESLVEWLKGREDKLRQIADLYRGEDWDGSNWRGKWADHKDYDQLDLSDELMEAVISGEIATYWEDVDQYLDGDPEGYDKSARAEDREAVVDMIVSEAADNGAVLRRDDVEDVLERRMEGLREKAQETILEVVNDTQAQEDDMSLDEVEELTEEELTQEMVRELLAEAIQAGDTQMVQTCRDWLMRRN